jgi:Protein of unknown function (DUF2892)
MLRIRTDYFAYLCMVNIFKSQLNFYIMIKNMGGTDKAIRLVLAAIVAILYFTGTISGTLAIILGVFAIIFALTSLVSFCPLYTLVGINTCSVKK